MVALWMCYATLVTALLAAAAWAADRAFAAIGRPRRWAWAAALAGGLALPAGSAWHASHAAALAPTAIVAPAAASAVADARAIALGAPGARATRAVGPAAARAAAVRDAAVRAWASAARALAPLDRPLTALWLVASAAVALFVARAAFAVRRGRRRWRAAQVDGERVWLTPDLGPALVGALRPRVVLPEWAVGALDAAEVRLVLAHERAHAAAGDPLLLAFALGAVAVAPWNVALWLLARRLRLAAEADCDRRVLRAHPDARRYARLLVAVAERVVAGAGRGGWRAGPVAAALLDPPGLLERRVEWLLAAGRPGARGAAAPPACAAAVAAAVVACAMPAPRSTPHVAAAGHTPCALDAACADSAAAAITAAGVRMDAEAARMAANTARVAAVAESMDSAARALPGADPLPAAEPTDEPAPPDSTRVRMEREVLAAAAKLDSANPRLRAQTDAIGSTRRVLVPAAQWAQMQADYAKARAMLSDTAARRLRARIDSMRARVDEMNDAMQRLVEQSARAAADSSVRAADAEIALMRPARPRLPGRAAAPAAEPPSADQLRAMVARHAPQAVNGQLGTKRTVWLLLDSTNRVVRAVAERDDPRTGTPPPNSQGMRRAFPELGSRWLRAGSVQWILPTDTLQVIWASPRNDVRTGP